MKPEIPSSVQALFNEAQAGFEKLMAAAPAQEMKHKADAMMQQTLSNMGAVSRADFEVQRDMLLALRARVDQLEAELVALKKPV